MHDYIFYYTQDYIILHDRLHVFYTTFLRKVHPIKPGTPPPLPWPQSASALGPLSPPSQSGLHFTCPCSNAPPHAIACPPARSPPPPTARPFALPPRPRSRARSPPPCAPTHLCARLTPSPAPQSPGAPAGFWAVCPCSSANAQVHAPAREHFELVIP